MRLYTEGTMHAGPPEEWSVEERYIDAVSAGERFWAAFWNVWLFLGTCWLVIRQRES